MKKDIIKNILIGYYLKIKEDLNPQYHLNYLPNISKTDPELIVSLTSYGSRVNSTLPYTLSSLFKQSKLPNKIVLNLDNDNWNVNNLPKKIEKYIKYGLEINFCKDIKSYKKLVPTLIKYPNSTIITVDDDYIYRKNLVEDLWNLHIKNPTSIITCSPKYPWFRSEGKIAEYNDWKEKQSNENLIVPIGVNGVLYPANSLHKDVIDDSLFMKLAPKADDLWFWIMGYLNNTKYVISDFKGLPGYSFDFIYQKLKIHPALMNNNLNNNGNDIQLDNIIKYYNIQFIVN